ncbi:serine/threonine-protein kinase [Cyanobacterium aponinum UTEX 3222]|uniref:Serine/threonine-protein kinase B n=2 Tax=Cyanobacterium aponinum TaxID=379064 RepID=A0A844GVE4_9CHRO|nr:serine/threonine-protein kinase [Cyanobacterium aponinum]WRL41442.1 serine/threonine-protein kinase [Cyanobacterium aponinum UTEX 3222]MBD2393441.1 pentapeptide repeat-containing protein [Cyanobacterium aponinum FACHB-4101]MTF39022.1 protein kinase [Cyanobacterium aponinum 0216]PHV62406.1 serine/threonine protein kinase [Cyanobacterium aponinum IPPAS B-1201]WPF89665.1 serine/threonine-protein kinase [Cyanobacterium aponinum AL20115]
MIISYCLNPNCSQPKNHPKLKQCYTCGANLILNNRYRAIKVLGKGGFGATFIGVDLTVTENPLCVIKQLRPNADDPQAVKTAINLFEREAKILGQINHHQIPKLLDYFEDQGQFYLIQELVNGQNLQREIKYEGVYGELALRRFLLEITPVLKYVHSQKIIHRDIKPANILRRKKDGKLILIDFGAVKDEVNTKLAKTFGQTALTKLSVGTMGYAPPEQLAMRPIYSSDIYALGATCLYLLTGKSPKNFPIDSDNGELLWQQEVSLSDKMVKILEKMLAINTRDRYKSVDDVIIALDVESLEGNMLSIPTPVSSVGANISSLSETEITVGDISKTMSPAQQLRQAIQKRKTKSDRPKKMLLKWNEERFFNAHNNGKKDFSDQELQNLNLQGSKLIKCIFRYSQLQGVNFKESSLSQANFYSADLTNANFINANLFQAYFSKSNLENVDFTGANLGSADFTNANVTNANFSGANLKNAKINQQQLKSAKVNRNTTFPDGSRLWWKIF